MDKDSSAPPYPAIHIVTQTFPPRMGGMEAVMHSLAQHCAKTGSPTTVYLNHPFNGENELFNKAYTPCPKFLRPTIKRRNVRRQSSAEDLFICDSWKSANALPRHAKHVVILAHGQEYLRAEKRQKRIQSALNRASHIISASAFTLELIKESWDITQAKATVIHPTYSLPDTLGERADKAASEKLQLLTISRLEARKGLAPVIQWLGKHHATLPKFRWVIGGNGPQKEDLQQLVLKLGLEKNIHFPGRVSDKEKEQLLSQADLFIMPSYQEGNSLEGFGISYIEAARYGVPAIGGLAGGTKEAVLHEKTGWSIDPLNEEMLGITLKEALSDSEKRSNYGNAAQMRYKNELAGSKAFEAFCEFIAS